MGTYPPFAQGLSYNTQLDPMQELAFQQWVAQNKVPVGNDYDMRGFWRGSQQGNPMTVAGVNPTDQRMHFSDYWKTPAHQSFSSESQWAGPNANQWINDSQLAAPSGRIMFDEKNLDGISPLVRALMGPAR